ncbi:MAG: DoxX family membrane protein [Deltaproteobacteria bacterium]|nr:DoxX family membrane protein [Deltaproteobacteria bacterium]
MSRFLDWNGHGWIALGLRLYLGVVFLLACWHKILHPASFALDVATYQILPLELVNLQALVLPWVELFVALMLVLGLRTRAAVLLVNAMMVMFMVALAIALARGLDMGCGCFASEGGDDPITWRTLVRDGTWLAMGLYVQWLDRRPLGLDRLLTRRTS